MDDTLYEQMLMTSLSAGLPILRDGHGKVIVGSPATYEQPNLYKPILDACCGGKMFYFDKDNPNVLFQDIRDVDMTLCDGRSFSIHPDVVADFRGMPYPDNAFRMVVFDPPHLLRNHHGSTVESIYSADGKDKPNCWEEQKYGSLGNADWRETIKQGFKECFRVLMYGGFLIFKWNETDIKTSEVLKLTTQKPIFGIKYGKREKSHWIVFMKNETDR